jgi:hypothetical protein
VLFENGWTSTQSCGVVGVGEGDGVGEGVGLGDGLPLGVGLGVGVGLSLAGGVALGVGLGVGVGLSLAGGLGVGVGLSLAGGVALGFGLADGVGLGGSVALGDELGLGLALAAWLGDAEAELSGSSASAADALAWVADWAFFDVLAVAAGRWAHALVALRTLAPEACATATPPEPLDTRSNPAMMLNVAVWVRPIAIVIETPLPRCRPRQGRRTALPYLITVRMSRLSHSLLSPFDTSCRDRCNGPRVKLCCPKPCSERRGGPDRVCGALL